MKICMISKYPPIEGGVSSSVYWLAKALGEHSHEVHVITNALEVEDKYREELDPRNPNFQPKNVHVHSTDPSSTIEANPSHIPFSKMYCEKLANTAIEVIENHDIDLIHSMYLVPYCVAGYLAKSLMGIPHVISHAGSDIQRLYPSPYLKKLLGKILKSADRIITNPEMASFFKNIGFPASKTSLMSQVHVETSAFNPKATSFDLKPLVSTQKYFPRIPIIAYIGKITHHYEAKGLPELVKACSKIDQDFLLLFVANGDKIGNFKDLVKQEKLSQKTLFLPFVPPWKVPSILKSCTCLVALENSNSPVIDYHVPVVPAEAMAVGRCVLMSKELHNKTPYTKFENGKEVIVVDSHDQHQLKEALENIITDSGFAEAIGAASRRAFVQQQNGTYVDEIVRIYRLAMMD